MLALTVTVPSPTPLVGLTVSQGGALVSATTVQVKVPFPRLVIPSIWLGGLFPCATPKIIAVGLTAKFGGTVVTVRFTATVWGLLVTPAAVTMMELL